MPEFIAIKSLSASDLTLLDRFFGVINRTGQKCINLNADVFVQLFYPDIETLTAARGGEVPVPITVFGPAAAPALRMNRSITKGDSYKNWRLNGETMHDPREQPDRFAHLQRHDLAVMAFDGRGLPERVTIVFLARDEPVDASLYAALAPYVARRSMAPITLGEVEAAIQAAGCGDAHPLTTFAVSPDIEAALEEAALGGFRGLRMIRRRRATRPVSRHESQRAREAAEQTGDDGERLVNAHFAALENPGGEFSFAWTSRVDAYSPFDFRIRHHGGALGDAEYVLDVKATRGAFERDFHLSFGEGFEAAESNVPYYIWRVYGITTDGAFMRRSGDIRDFARALIETHDRAMPAGVAADAFSVQVAAHGLTWSEPVVLAAALGEEDEAADAPA
ncbi:DUF3883 domain-containing protein [Lichenicoccus roseus]|uniref:DUF3883 domain-containing protein n=1 Tax=Lichenicoccus roseus TaxID=2683649 RepID=A0A5R9J2N1_9PROT|nr:DUF3883 domain-containing protein [Lichenicoccus roseus]TLU71229.1 DUF3883 domain-containing protein [Lichenicoccus roseus]